MSSKKKLKYPRFTGARPKGITTKELREKYKKAKERYWRKTTLLKKKKRSERSSK